MGLCDANLNVPFQVTFSVQNLPFQAGGVVVSPHRPLRLSGRQVHLGQGERFTLPPVRDFRDEQRQVGAAGVAWLNGRGQGLGGVLPVCQPGVHGGQTHHVVAVLPLDVGRHSAVGVEQCALVGVVRRCWAGQRHREGRVRIGHGRCHCGVIQVYLVALYAGCHGRGGGGVVRTIAEGLRQQDLRLRQQVGESVM